MMFLALLEIITVYLLIKLNNSFVKLTQLHVLQQLHEIQQQQQQ